MTPKAKKALEGSIRKWERIVLGTGGDMGDDNCPLCKAFLARDCKGCPIFVKTGRATCDGTPYARFIKHSDLQDDKGAFHPSDATGKKAALDMLRLLESLR